MSIISIILIIISLGSLAIPKVREHSHIRLISLVLFVLGLILLGISFATFLNM